jgi:DNA polymerase-3 subunit epsilon/oligoribonuclease
VLAIFLDTEANGLNYKKHQVIELALKIIDIETGKEKGIYHSVVLQTLPQWEGSDPLSLEVNGFTWEEVSLGKKTEIIAKEIIDLFALHKIQRGNAVFICQNPSFDRAFFAQIIDPDLQEKLLWPYHWLDLASMYWAKALTKKQTEANKMPWVTGLSKDKIAKVYKLPPEENPHRAMNGVDHLILCYEAIVGFPLKNTNQ